MDISIKTFPTPNPNAKKFVLDKPVKNSGKSTYKSLEDCGENELARSLLQVGGVDSVHFFLNSITITKNAAIQWSEIELFVVNYLQNLLPSHNPDYNDPDPEEERRNKLTPELLQIEKILDETIRPGLQNDGGDVVCLELKDNVLFVKYQGACGTCPSATTGTLQAIRSILRSHLNNEELEVYSVPY